MRIHSLLQVYCDKHIFLSFLSFFFLSDVRPPTITCPQSISTATDPGKPTKTISIPAASAVDNSGQQPTITNNAGAQSKDFVVSSTPHEVQYTARDSAGLTSTCTLLITVLGEKLLPLIVTVMMTKL